jgi:hypothetical protein
MTRKGKNIQKPKKEPLKLDITDWNVEGEITARNVYAQPFDLLLQFSDNSIAPTILVDEDTKVLIEGLLVKYKRFTVKVNWWSKDLQVLIPSEDQA